MYRHIPESLIAKKNLEKLGYNNLSYLNNCKPRLKLVHIIIHILVLMKIFTNQHFLLKKYLKLFVFVVINVTRNNSVLYKEK